MDPSYEQICSGATCSPHLLQQLTARGFVPMSGALPQSRLPAVVAAYDEVMSRASGPGYKIGTTTNRMSDLLSHTSAFDELLVYPPLLEACAHVIGEPFRLSSFLARTLRPGTGVQELHSDLPRGSEDAPLVGFIVMIDAFREDNGATRFVPGSHRWDDVPANCILDTRGKCAGEVLCCGDSGDLIVFDASIWHGHTANVSTNPRRSVQGYFIKRSAPSVTSRTASSERVNTSMP